MRQTGLFFPVVLGTLTAFGPFVTDFYLPVLPEMGQFFHTSPSLIGMSLTAGMTGLAAGQLLIGPLTDRYGRRLILIGAMIMFVLASLGCVFSTNIFVFNLMRLFQGLGGAGGIVISKSMASDTFSGRDLAKFMALLGAINGVTPVVAPLVGGVMAGFTSWQGIFALLLAIGLILAICCIRLPETLIAERRIRRSPISLYANLFRVFRNRKYAAVIIYATFGAMVFFSYIASSTFILQETYGLSPLTFSLCFAFNAIMIGLGAGVAATFRSTSRCLVLATWIQLAGALCVGACLWLGLSVWLLMASYLLMLTGFGLWQPGATAVALDLERANSGAASAVFGAVFFLAGGLASSVVGIGNICHTATFIAVGGSLLCLAIIIPLAPRLKRLERPVGSR